VFYLRTKLLGALTAGALVLGACGSDTSPAAAPETATSEVISTTPNEVSTEAPDVTSTAPTTTEPAANDTVEPLDTTSTTEAEIDESEQVVVAAVAGDAEAGDAEVTIRLEIADGSVVGGAQRLQADTGQVVLIEVKLDEADEVHVHGYEFVVEGAGDEIVQIAFVAQIPGVWEVELEGLGIELLELEVS